MVKSATGSGDWRVCIAQSWLHRDHPTVDVCVGPQCLRLGFWGNGALWHELSPAHISLSSRPKLWKQIPCQPSQFPGEEQGIEQEGHVGISVMRETIGHHLQENNCKMQRSVWILQRLYDCIPLKSQQSLVRNSHNLIRKKILLLHHCANVTGKGPGRFLNSPYP